MRGFRIIALLILLTAGLTTRAQPYRNNFDNGFTWYPPWTNIVLDTDSTLTEGGYVCLCDTAQEFGFGFSYDIPDSLNNSNLFLRFEADYRFPDSLASGSIVLSIGNDNETRYWNSYPLSNYANDTTGWFHVSIETNLPNDYLHGCSVNSYLWNIQHSKILIDNAELTITPWAMPSYLPNVTVSKEHWGIVCEYIMDGDTIAEYNPLLPNLAFPAPTELYTELYIAISGIDTTNVVITSSNVNVVLASKFYKDCQLLRQALVIPFSDSTLTVFRRNMAIDTSGFQSAYYLDREGFKIGEGDHTMISYHQTDISSTQLDTKNKVVYFNLDYWRDHPMIHYPLSDTLEDHFEDRSCRQVYKGMKWNHYITLYQGDDVPNLPRIMKIPYGYESGIIFTEHADWTDIRTHRAVLFGSEKITKVKDAIGGFVYYGIPVTKSVFYNNPDQVTNDEISHGTFTGLHATIKTHREFEKLLKELYKNGFDICLHTPEQYTTTPSNLKEAMRFMRRNFHSVSWIDHGYNNGPEHNREDLVCDGLNPESDYYACELWKDNGVKYLWNAYYEEHRMEPWCFDCNLMQPYPGFGDALPNRQVTAIAGLDYYYGLQVYYRLTNPDFLAWSTPSTLEAVTDPEWDFYYNEQRLQKIVDNHDVHITHIYPAWVKPGRTFWTYDEDSTIVALPGMNRALERISHLRDEHMMLPMTIKTYLDYYSGLLQVYYEIVDKETIHLINNGEEIKGFTLLCPSPVYIEDNRFYEFRKSGEYYYVWFDLKPNDTVTIKIKTPN